MGGVERREWLKHRVYKLKHYDRHYDRHESGYSVMIYHENITIGSTRVYLGLPRSTWVYGRLIGGL